MKLNCKPGDLAVIIKPTSHGTQVLGMLATVLHAAPGHGFNLPDGFPQEACPAGYWVLEFPREIEAPINLGGKTAYRRTLYGVAPDRCLRPIRDPGEDATDETLQWLDAPTQQGETV